MSVKKKAGPWLLSLLAVVTLSISSSGCTVPEPTQSLDEQAREIYRLLMCPLCPGQTIEQSQSELASQMRDLVREKLAQGETKEEILQFFVERYGEGVLAAPAKSGFNLIIWLAPVVAIFAGGIALSALIRGMIKRKSKISNELLPLAPDDNRGGKYHKQLERELEDFEERGFR